MYVVLTIAVGDAADMLDAHLAFHLNTGVDFVVAADRGSQHPTTEILEAYARDGYVRRISSEGTGPGAAHTEMARLAVVEHGADWVIPSSADEFWWPRGESLRDVLAVIPQRYAVVQALVRTFVEPLPEGRRFTDDMKVRTSLLGPEGSAGKAVQNMLRPVYRAEPNMVVDPEDWTLGGRRVPLRAWYPIEVFHLAGRSSDPVDDARLGDLIADGTLVVDTRLRDVLHDLRDTAGDTGLSRFTLPGAGMRHITFPVPNIVDDASYAIECAAVGEVDLVRLDAQIREFELRIAALEARIWPRVRRALRRLARRPS